MTGPQDPAAAGRNRLRAGHADREQVIGTLKDAFVHGRLTKDELDARAGRALTARTHADLAALTADITAEPAAAGPARPPAPARRRPLARAATGSGLCLVIAAAAVRVAFLGRSRCPLHSLSGLGCPNDAPGLSRRRRGARHLGVRGGRLMGAQALPRAAAARAGARRLRPGRRTARRHRPGSGSPRPPRRPDPRRPARSQATAAHSRPGGPGTPRRAGLRQTQSDAGETSPDWCLSGCPGLGFYV